MDFGAKKGGMQWADGYPFRLLLLLKLSTCGANYIYLNCIGKVVAGFPSPAKRVSCVPQHCLEIALNN